jgi:hypothetical protein
MKILNKIVSLSLTAVLIISAVSCSGASTSSSETSTAVTESATEAETTSEIADSLPETDLNGYTFTIGSDSGIAKNIVVEENDGDVVNEAVYKANLAVEERFNADIKQIIYTVENDYGNQAMRSVKAGEDVYDIFCALDILAAPWTLEGWFYDLYQVPNLDFTKPWWPANTVDALSVMGHMYMFSNWIDYTGMSWTRVLFFNGGMLDDLNLGRPYDSVKDGTWTIDSLIAMTKSSFADLNGNNEFDTTDRLGFTTRNGGDKNSWGYQFLLESCGISAAAKDDKGVPYAVTDVDKLSEAVGKFSELFNVEGNKADIWTRGNELFYDGNVMFVYGELGLIIDWGLRDVDFLYGVVPFPKLDEAQKGYISEFTAMPYMMPVTVPESDLNADGIIIEAMSAEGYRTVKDVYFETALKQKYTYEDGSMEMLDIINSTRAMDFWYVYGDSNTYGQNILWNTLDDLSVASYMAKQAKVVDNKIKNLIKSVDKISGTDTATQ